MKYLALMYFIILFSGCSTKCIQHNNCNALEGVIKGTIDVTGEIIKFIPADSLLKL